MKWTPAALCFTLMAAAPPKPLEPQQPVLQWIYPAGGRQGGTLDVTLAGTAVEPQTVLVSGEGVRARRVDDRRVEVEIASDAPPGLREFRVLNAGGVSNRFRFEVGDLPEILEQEPNSDKATPQAVESLPVVINGQIQEGDRDYFRFHASAGQTIVCEVEGRSLLPFLADAVPGWFDPMLAVYDASGRQVAYADDFRFRPDPLLIFRAPRDGDYTLELRDVIYRGRGDFVYRLKLGSPEAIRPDLRALDPPKTEARSLLRGVIAKPGQSDVYPLRAEKGERLVMEVQARRFGSPLDSILTLMNDRGQVLAENDDWTDPSASATTHQADSRIAYTFPVAGDYKLRIRDVQGKGGDDYEYRIAIGRPKPDFALRISPDNPRLGQGDTAAIAVSAVRRDEFTGEIALSVEGLPPGFVASEAVIPAGQNEGRLTITAPPDAPLRVLSPKVIGTAAVGAHEAVPCEAVMQAFAYTHYLPAERLYLAVIPAAAFSISADRQSIELKPGEERQVTVKVRRLPGVTAPVTVQAQRLANASIVAKAGQVPAGKDEVTITVTADKEAKPGLRQDLIFSAILRSGAQTVTRYARAITVRVSESK